MGLIDKIVSPNPKQEITFTVDELKFLLSKMRNSTYTGHEFEMFYSIWVKITDMIARLENR